MKRLPTLFLSHGSPMQAVEPGVAGKAWAALGNTLPRPRAVLMVSAHWETSLPTLTGNPQPKTIHDFGGFPPELYRIQYNAPGSPAVAARAAALLKAEGITASIDEGRGLDHGAWVPLRWMYPQADIPVVQLSVQPERGTAHHLSLGRAIASLSEEGVLIVGSGHMTHNLRDWIGNARRPEPLRYAQAFAGWVEERMRAGDDAALIAYREQAPDALRAHPSEEHFLPLFVAWGAAGINAGTERIVDAYEGGALAMHSYLFHQRAA
jgi:4,5-DOPA dioxygenase extradiol